MLVLKVELWPGGDENQKRVLARAGIGDMSELADISDYEVVVSDGANPLAGIPAGRDSPAPSRSPAAERPRPGHTHDDKGRPDKLPGRPLASRKRRCCGVGPPRLAVIAIDGEVSMRG
jgi:hypothetical protein